MTLTVNIEALRFDENGLIPAIVQDAVSKEVLTLAYMNKESLAKSLETKETWFWSRSRQELWHKGATSGHTQRIVSIKYDCDKDALVVLVVPQGPACHTGSYSCFAGQLTTVGITASDKASAATEANASTATETDARAAAGSGIAAATESSILAKEKIPSAVSSDRFSILNELEQLIASREAERPEGAYTTYLFEKGVDKILKKVGEEAAEVIIAAKNRSHDELRYEAADLLYHLLVLLREQKLPLDDVLAELQKRR
ncbi:bifunctional phosphoribosyl-AMP cyclohydrolase/phosphoribosyl-ATP diphosphatase HisIE [Brevibacillus borstelensis]|jgi:phosphoribosyl-AMP cyclohydrolase / phosphoribosyl-ATP pyrophosphohydrolase|uniref:Histidine biosynthesis bifunctional protein HisIE n=1 Tax=Brevibacillus borstelensis AK1 TaxID=1300222 RepID=M8D7H2_9BACL|nr:bifunctional phosphoribosyl-AMP cyclohydrolase/phosphoribosyl-ATP diphosphatase HisIE [Brevibacillus borstelensis]EMT52184.1 bifunctional phosphoribosyl-AMP cyclohydrolase/phosphoribosyl-ATP pyrophosphatase protein [Brevibacillus borstelensis AK1]KKX54636.1 phosphoribosyl-ATP pyrophosphatase [Brevibacillus borstelensis cifa_chp40]MBE5396861.1 bifunctional phosphoribosyl-AMP cyclohydrolase/phosphoribosyl-ATP diphosphatase HisIE [Brevibacillus borstelensis]MED1746777.1 bifunctional phosphoribo